MSESGTEEEVAVPEVETQPESLAQTETSEDDKDQGWKM